MSNLESAFISRNDYDKNIDQRIHNDTYTVDELYITMIALESNVHNYEAAKVPIRFRDVQDFNLKTFASLAMLDIEGRVTARPTGTFVDGYWIDARDCIKISKVPVIQAYIRDYDPEGADSDIAQTMSKAYDSRLTLCLAG